VNRHKKVNINKKIKQKRLIQKKTGGTSKKKSTKESHTKTNPIKGIKKTCLQKEIQASFKKNTGKNKTKKPASKLHA
jgi:hypothetical protein